MGMDEETDLGVYASSDFAKFGHSSAFPVKSLADAFYYFVHSVYELLGHVFYSLHTGFYRIHNSINL